MELSKHLQAVIKADRSQLEATGQMTQSILDALFEAGIFKLFVPKQFNGKAASLPYAIQVFEAISRLDGNVGWVVAIGTGGGIFSGHLPPSTAQRIYNPRNALIAGSGFPSGKATAAEGGYRVSGRWKYCSGSPHASYFTASTMVQQGEKETMMAVAMPPEHVSIEPTWNAMGLKATTGHDVVVDDIFVPTNHTFTIDESKPATDIPIMRYPFVQLAEASFAAVVLGIARHFVAEVQRIIDGKAAYWQEHQPRALNIANDKLGNSQQALNKVGDKFHTTIKKSWAPYELNSKASIHKLESVSTASRKVAAAARKAASQLMPITGITAIMEDQRINQLWRDLHTAAQHALLSPLRG